MACTESIRFAEHRFDAASNIVWGIHAAVRPAQMTGKPTNARPTRRGAPPH